MKFITVSELRAHATSIVAQIESTEEEVIVTKNGRPVVLIRPVTEGEFELKPYRIKGGEGFIIREKEPEFKISMKGGKPNGKSKGDIQKG